MTKYYCDFCKKEITVSDGPIYISAVHLIGNGVYCKDCFFDKKNLSSIKIDLLKEIEEYASRYQ